MKYIYKPLQFTIEGIGQENGYSYLFEDYVSGKSFLSIKDKEDIITKVSEQIAFYHELTHFEQDNCFFACISKGLFEESITEIVFSSNTLSKLKFPLYDRNGFLNTQVDNKLSIVSTIFNSIFCIPAVPASDVNYTKYAKMGYREMLESHAEIKSIFNFIIDYEDAENFKDYINFFLKRDDRYGLHLLKDASKEYISFDGNANYVNRRYQVARHNFLNYFINHESNFLKFDLGECTLDLQTLLFCYSTELPIGNEIVMNYLRLTEYYMMIAIEIAMAIPPASFIIAKCWNNPNLALDYNPCCRFFKVLDVFDRYSTVFNKLNIENTKWAELFNYISDKCGWPNYKACLDMYKRALTVNDQHRSMLSFGQLDHIMHKGLFSLKQTMLSMYDIFLIHNKSFAIYQDNKYIVTFSKDKNEIKEVVIDLPEWRLIYDRLHTPIQDRYCFDSSDIYTFAKEYVTDLIINNFGFFQNLE